MQMHTTVITNLLGTYARVQLIHQGGTGDIPAVSPTCRCLCGWLRPDKGPQL
jgi:hypothetical protein